MRITRPIVLLALTALLAPCAEASRTSVWESHPPAAAVLAKADATSALAALAPAAAADAETTEPQIFNLGDVVLNESALEHEDRFNLGPLELLSPAPLRGPPSSYPETRVGGFELLQPFRVGASPRLSLWSRQACGSISCELASDSPEDPWGLMDATTRKVLLQQFQREMAEKESEGPTMSAGPTDREFRQAQLMLEARDENNRNAYRWKFGAVDVVNTLPAFAAPAAAYIAKTRAVPEEAPVARPSLSANPRRRGYEVEDVRAREAYSKEKGYTRTVRGTSSVDFREGAGIEKVELKSLDQTRRSYLVEDLSNNRLADRLVRYRDQLLKYDRTDRTPINVLEVQLVGGSPPTFQQDAVLRGFIKDSLKEGVLVEVHDYQTGKLLMGPPKPEH